MSAVGNVVLWLILAIVFIVVEGITVQLVSLWFVIGTIPAMIAAAAGAGYLLQGILFLATSILVLIFFRPILQKRLRITKKPTNADRVIGMRATVLEEIDNLSETGRVHANGLDWTARAVDDSMIIAKDSLVQVLSIEGVKLIVAPEQAPTAKEE